MSRFKVRVSNSLEENVLKRAEEIADAGEIEGVANIRGMGVNLRVYIDKKPKSVLLVFLGAARKIEGKVIYLGIDA